jgi:hypothetical protein
MIRAFRFALFAAASQILLGCANLDNYDRSYSICYEGAKATVALSPRTPRALPINQDIPPGYRK